MYLVVLYIFIRWKGRVTIIVTITFLRIYATSFLGNAQRAADLQRGDT